MPAHLRHTQGGGQGNQGGAQGGQYGQGGQGGQDEEGGCSSLSSGEDALTDASILTDLVEDRSNLLREIEEEGLAAGSFPPSPLDMLIDELGGPRRVAEMTGRSHRCVWGNIILKLKLSIDSLTRSRDDRPLPQVR